MKVTHISRAIPWLKRKFISQDDITVTGICPFLHLSPMKGVYFSQKKTYQGEQVESQQEERTRNLKLYFLLFFSDNILEENN